MATPDTDHQSNEVEWALDNAYRPMDNYGAHVCAMTGFDQRKGELIYRGPHIDDFMGYFAIGQDAAEQLARLIGWIDPDDLVSTPDELLLSENLRLAEQVELLEETLEALRKVMA